MVLLASCGSLYGNYHYYAYLGSVIGEEYMSGVTKHIFEHEIMDIISMWNMQLKSIQELLPKDYADKDVIDMLKFFIHMNGILLR